MSSRKKIFFIFGICIAGLLSYFFFFSSPKITNYPSQGKDIVAFGDSLVEGVGSSNGGFVKMVSQNSQTPIINLGKSGDTTADGITRLPEIFEYAPKVVIVLLGGNDALRRISRQETFKNLETIIVEIQKHGSIVLLLGVRGGLLSDGYSDDFKALSKKYGTAYVPDVLSGIFGHADLLAEGIHPNDKGYEIIAGKVEKALDPLLKP